MKPGKVYVGTSGWNYRDWKGRFYPPALKPAEWLGYLARRFDTTEINTTFYRIPKVEFVRRWSQQVPGRFRFAVKLWRGITQYRKLADCREYLPSFFEALAPLAVGQRGPLLVQLPPSLGKDLERLDAFLDEVREVTSPRRWRVAVEFRNPTWLCDETYALLDRQAAAIVLHDMQRAAPVQRPNDVGFVYIRRHGPTGRYAGGYSSGQIKRDAASIARWSEAGKAVFIYYNNDVEGHAVTDAEQLRRMLGQGATGAE